VAAGDVPPPLLLVSQVVTLTDSKSIFRKEYNCIAICSYFIRLSVIYMEILINLQQAMPQPVQV